MQGDPRQTARLILDACLRREPPPAALLAELVDSESPAIFTDLVEPLSDSFEPYLCDAYADLFSRVIARVLPEFDAAALRARYGQLRAARVCRHEPHRIFVLSRVTLGADVAVTSVVLDAMKRRFPGAEVIFVGPEKNYRLFSADSRIRHASLPFGRTASLRDRLTAGMALRDLVTGQDSIVVDPDSRLTQLGMLPVCEPERCYFFESRSFGGDGGETLGGLARRWLRRTFEVEAASYIAPAAGPAIDGEGLVCLSFGVGENPAKRVADPFEQDLIAWLVSQKLPLLIDQGAGGEEARRVQSAIARSGAPAHQVRTWLGDFAPFAANIARSRLYIGYDSSGQHVAAAAGTPLVTIFAGFACERMYQRWYPSGKGPVHVVKVPSGTLQSPLQAIREAVQAVVLAS